MGDLYPTEVWNRLTTSTAFRIHDKREFASPKGSIRAFGVQERSSFPTLPAAGEVRSGVFEMLQQAPRRVSLFSACRLSACVHKLGLEILGIWELGCLVPAAPFYSVSFCIVRSMQATFEPGLSAMSHCDTGSRAVLLALCQRMIITWRFSAAGQST